MSPGDTVPQEGGSCSGHSTGFEGKAGLSCTRSISSHHRQVHDTRNTAWSSLWLSLLQARASPLATVSLVRRPVLLLALGAAVPGHLAASTDVELSELQRTRDKCGCRQADEVLALRLGLDGTRQGCGEGAAGPGPTCFSMMVQGG